MQKKKHAFFGISITILIFMLFHFFGFTTTVENKFINIINFGSGSLFKIGIILQNNFTSLFNRSELLSQLELAEKEKLECKFDSSQVKILKEENDELKKQINFFSNNEYKHIGANVIGKNLDPIGTNILIDKGSDSEIEINNPVLVGDGILVGKIVKVNKNSSLIRLINDNDSAVAATIENMDKSVGLIEGGYGLSIKLNFIPQNEVINQGDLVITSGLEEGIPKGLLIGEVEIIEKVAQEPFQEAIVRPLIDLQKISLVSIIIKNSN